MACKALPAMYDYLKDKYGLKFIITSRINQDCVGKTTKCFAAHLPDSLK